MKISNFKFLISKNKEGQTLIEVVVAMGMVTLVLVTVVAGVVLSVRNTRFAKEQALATRYAQEGLEWIRQQRDQLGWTPFYDTLEADASANSVIYCLSTLPSSTAEFEALAGGECDSDDKIGSSVFMRELTADLTSTSNVEVMTRVSWQEGGRTHQSQLTSKLTEWEQ